MYPKPIQKLIELFSRFPGVGQRTAGRFVFYLLKAQEPEFSEFIATLQNLRKEIHECSFCLNPFEVRGDEQRTGLCTICRDKTRDHSVLCVVEKESDLETLEKTKQYHGRYFILGKLDDILKKEGFQTMRTQELKNRISNELKEIILALNPTAEGETATLYLERLLKPYGKKITRLARGLPVGGELEYADEETLRSALEGRRESV